MCRSLLVPALAILIARAFQLALAQPLSPPPGAHHRHHACHEALEVESNWDLGGNPGMLPCASSDAELEDFYHQTMEHDLQNWRPLGPLNRTHLDAFMNKWKWTGFHHQSMVFIYQGRWYYPFHHAWNHTQATKDKYEAGITLWVGASHYYFQQYKNEIEFPDSFFFLSDQDGGWCGDPSNCPMPAFSITKSSPTTTDLLFPFMPNSEHPLYNFPFELKHDRAFFNGRPNWGHSPKHFNGTQYWSRQHMANLSLREPHRVHAALMGDPTQFPGVRISDGEVSLQNHARWKYLMNLDGVTYAGRLSRLMHTDSVLLKEETTWPEYFVRAMKPNVHYLPIFKDGPDDVLDVMSQWGNRTLELKRIAYNTQQFARRFLCARARMLYFRRLISEYNKLFISADGRNHMQEFIAEVLLPVLEARKRGDTKLQYMDITPYDPQHPHQQGRRRRRQREVVGPAAGAGQTASAGHQSQSQRGRHRSRMHS